MVGYKITQFHRKSPINGTILKFRCRTQLCRNMMRENDNLFSHTLRNSLLYKSETTLMLMVKIIGCQPVFPIQDTIEITDTPFRHECIVRLYFRP